MYRALRIILACAALLAAAASAHAWRCGNLFVREGVLLEGVLEYCGTPVSRQTISGEGEGLKRERLVYGPEGGLYYILTFENGVLTKVEQRREP